MIGDLAIEEHASAINALLETHKRSTFDIAEKCAAADADLNPDEKKKLHKKLHFDKYTFSKHVAIGKHPTLRSYEHILPDGYSLLYELSHFSPEKLQELSEKKALNPKLSRPLIQSWRAGKQAKDGDQDANQSVTLAAIKLPVKEVTTKAAELERLLQEFGEAHGCLVELKIDFRTQKVTKAQDEFDKYVRRCAKEHMKEIKELTLRPYKKFKHVVRSQIWPEDEAKILQTSSFEEMEAAFKFVKREDIWKKITEDAYDKFGGAMTGMDE